MLEARSLPASPWLCCRSEYRGLGKGVCIPALPFTGSVVSEVTASLGLRFLICGMGMKIVAALWCGFNEPVYTKRVAKRLAQRRGSSRGGH